LKRGYRQSAEHKRKISESQRARYQRMRDAVALSERLQLVGAIVSDPKDATCAR
jgi:hypothetical protein